MSLKYVCFAQNSIHILIYVASKLNILVSKSEYKVMHKEYIGEYSVLTWEERKTAMLNAHKQAEDEIVGYDVYKKLDLKILSFGGMTDILA